MTLLLGWMDNLNHRPQDDDETRLKRHSSKSSTLLLLSGLTLQGAALAQRRVSLLKSGTSSVPLFCFAVHFFRVVNSRVCFCEGTVIV